MRKIATNDTRKNLIKEAALLLFSTKGYHYTSTKMVSDAAGVSKGLLFFHFPSKEDLLKELMLEWLDQMWDEVIPETYISEDYSKALEIFLDAIFETLVKYEPQYRLYYSLLLTENPFSFVQVLKDTKSSKKLEIYLKWLLEGLKINAIEREIRFISSILLGAEMNFLLLKKDQRFEFEKVKTRIIELYTT